jgi:hypothetical protein
MTALTFGLFSAPTKRPRQKAVIVRAQADSATQERGADSATKRRLIPLGRRGVPDDVARWIVAARC